MDTMVDHYIDAKGLLCPLPVLKFKKYIKNLEAGAQVLIESTDPDSVKDFKVFSEMKGFRILSIENSENIYTFVIEI